MESPKRRVDKREPYIGQLACPGCGIVMMVHSKSIQINSGHVDAFGIDDDGKPTVLGSWYISIPCTACGERINFGVDTEAEFRGMSANQK